MQQEITINWHITQQCNYHCHYCFAHYKKDMPAEAHSQIKSIQYFLPKLYEAFKRRYPDYALRLNIAGGEPLCALFR